MYICKVVGKAISTVKNDKLEGAGIVMVRPMASDKNGKAVLSTELYAAVDPFGCAVDNLVLVTSGANARYACKASDAPVDMAVVGILDSNELK